jgi:hypothetical protein
MQRSDLTAMVMQVGVGESAVFAGALPGTGWEHRGPGAWICGVFGSAEILDIYTSHIHLIHISYTSHSKKHAYLIYKTQSSREGQGG